MGSYSSKKRFTVLGHSVVFNCVQIDLLKKANFFGVLFNMALVYSDLICETPQIGKITGLNQVFKLAFEDQGNMEAIGVAIATKIKLQVQTISTLTS